ncbi:MAG TPA: alpha/beta hydrolase, partial [Pseudorhizobium sp.]|nr:alpha/beta hydrolase [Pseudorhizobium sp.]
MITGAAHPSRRLRAVFLPLLLALSLSGCAGRPEGVLIPTASAAAPGQEVDIFVATTRQPSRDPGILFSGERGRDLEATAITVSIPPDANRKIGEVQWPKRLPADPAQEFATVRVEPVETEKGANRWLSRHLPPSKRVFVFVHGFNNRYEEAVYRFAQIVHDSNAEAAPVL